MVHHEKKNRPANLSAVKTYSYKKRKNKTNLESFAKPFNNNSVSKFFESLPKQLKAVELIEFIDLTVKARKRNKPFHLLMGAHTIKVGLSPIIIDLMKHNIVTGISFNGAGLIHDLELAFWGGTSEDVQKGLKDGSFGMAKETAHLFAEVVKLAKMEKLGLGEAGGKYILSQKAKYAKHSVFAMAYKYNCPATIHVGIGTDIVAQHPNFDAAETARASHMDFKILAEICKKIDRGGVVANIGSAVILPEVFLKALTVARNLSKGKSALTTANFDMIMHYRPMVNVVTRPTDEAGKGFNFIGHHEIMIPLFAWGIKNKF